MSWRGIDPTDAMILLNVGKANVHLYCVKLMAG